MTNAKKEFTREEVEFTAHMLQRGSDGDVIALAAAVPKAKQMLQALAARLAEDEAIKPVGKALAYFGGGHTVCFFKEGDVPVGTPLYTRRKP